MDLDYTVFPLVGCVGVLLFMAFVVAYRPKNMANLLFTMFCLTASVWLFGTYKMFITLNDAGIIFWDHFVYIGVTLMSVFLYHFGIVYTNRRGHARAQRAIVVAGYVFGLFFLIASQTSEKFISGVFRYKWGAHTIAGPLHHIFILFFLFYFLGFLSQMFGFYRKCHGVAKTQLFYVLAGFSVLVIIGPFAYLPAYQIPTLPFVFVAVIPFVLFLFHAMFKYNFLSEFDELLISSAKIEAEKHVNKRI